MSIMIDIPPVMVQEAQGYVSLEGKSLAETTIGAEELNHNGSCSAELVFDTSNIRYLQFPVFPAAGQTIEVTGIHYQRIG